MGGPSIDDRELVNVLKSISSDITVTGEKVEIDGRRHLQIKHRESLIENKNEIQK